MLDTIFRNGGERKQAHDELRALLFQARSERAALRTMLDQATGTSEKLARTTQALDELAAKTDGMTQQVARLAEMTTAFDQRTKGFEKLEARVDELLHQVADAKRVSQSFVADDGDLQQHRQAMEALSAQARGAQATVVALRQEGEKFEGLRTLLQHTTAEVEQSAGGLAALKSEIDALRSSEVDLRTQMQDLRELARDAHEDSTAAAQAVKAVDDRLASFAQLQELSKDTEKRLASLNALAEHVSHKARALETQRHTVEHAVVEATRLNEMVWNMDTQIAKLADGRDQLQRTEETVARVEQLAKQTTQELAAATTSRDEFLRQSAQFDAQGRSLADYLRSAIERLTVDKKEFDAFDQRLKSLSAAVGETETRVHSVLAKDESLAAMQQKTEALSKTFAALALDAEDLARRQDGLESLSEQLANVDALGKRTAAQHQSLMQSQQDLDAVRRDLTEFHTAYAEAVQLRDKLALDRTALDAFAERTATMLSRTPEIESRLDAVLGKLSLVDEGSQAAARLGEVTAELDAQLTRVGSRLQFVEKLEERVNGLHVVTTDVERKLADQLARRAEVEGLKSLCDTLGAQISDAQLKLDGVSALQSRLLPITSQVATLQQTLETSQKLVDTMKKDEAVVHEQQARFAELVEQGRRQAAEAGERLKQVQAVSDDLGRATTLKEELLAELTRVQARQRDAVAQTDAAEDQIKRAEAAVRQIEQRRTQLAQTEKAIAVFEGRLGELGRGTEAVEQKIKSLADREALVQAVKVEVDNIRQISSKSRADLQFVTDHRSDVSDLRTKVEDLMGRVTETDDKIAMIESRRRMVEDVQARASTITNMLGDIHVNLEMLGEQRAVIDHVGEKLARLDFTVQEAQNTLRALQREREVAERIEQGIKALRARSNGAAAA
jgi:chromosome segregation ATPase